MDWCDQGAGDVWRLSYAQDLQKDNSSWSSTLYWQHYWSPKRGTSQQLTLTTGNCYLNCTCCVNFTGAFRAWTTCTRLRRTPDLTGRYSVCFVFYVALSSAGSSCDVPPQYVASFQGWKKRATHPQNTYALTMEKWGCIWCTSCDLSDQIDGKCILNASRCIVTALDPIKQWERANTHWGI